MPDDLQSLAADLGGMSRDIRTQLRARLRDAARPIVAEAKSRASWSSRIPGAISVQAFSFRPSLFIRVSSAAAPHARLYELGAQGRGTFFRHPVYGNRATWVSQRTRPFLYPAARAHQNDVMDAAGKAVEAAARRRGFH